MSEQANIEAVGQNYDAEMMLVARQKTRQVMRDIAAGMRPGMTEEQGTEFARQTLKEAGLLRGWHGIFVRFGTNTLKDYYETSEPGVVLQENDVFFLDIGPIWQKWEGDAGDTFVVGNDADMLRAAHDVRSLFSDVHRKWRNDGDTGQALYKYAEQRATEMGWVFNLKVDGHRIGDFPHKAIHSGSLSSTTFKPTTDLWVLELQIRHPTRPFGAFYEDLLLNNLAEESQYRTVE
jgi:Xaa-Pro aminopeptidase